MESKRLSGLVNQPFELLLELERRSRAAHAGHGAGAAPSEWVGVGFRIGEEHFVAERDQVREVLMLPDTMTRVPGASRWLLGIANLRGHLLPGLEPAGVPGELNGDMADTTGAAVNQHRLSPLESGAIEQCFPGGEQHQRRGSGLFETQRSGFVARHAGGKHCVFGVVARFPSQATVAEPDRVTGLQRRDVRADLFHGTGAVTAQDGGQRPLEKHAAAAQLGVDGVYPGCAQLHPDLGGGGELRLGQFDQLQDLVEGHAGAPDLDRHLDADVEQQVLGYHRLHGAHGGYRVAGDGLAERLWRYGLGDRRRRAGQRPGDRRRTRQ